MAHKFTLEMQEQGPLGERFGPPLQHCTTSVVFAGTSTDYVEAFIAFMGVVGFARETVLDTMEAFAEDRRSPEERFLAVEPGEESEVRGLSDALSLRANER